MTNFIGREPEFKILSQFLQKKTASLIVIRGRRRIGKSRLVEEFAKGKKFYNFTGFPPVDLTTEQSQRDDFGIQLSQQTDLPEIKSDDWSKSFFLLADKVKKGSVIVFFDEISWMGSKDPNFLGKLKNAWDMYFKKNEQLVFILCGSASFWIEKNILSSAGFLGRISYTLTLEELPLMVCRQFWGKQEEYVSPYEKLKVLAITGGVPKYLEEINPIESAEENIKRLCFHKGGFLVDEFDHIFTDLFSRRSATYKKIIYALANGPQELKQIGQFLKTETSGRLTEYLEELELSGFIRRSYTWNLVTGEDTKLSQYRLSDNYLRFYLKYIEKYKTKIKRNAFAFKALTSLQDWYGTLGLQFENLVLNNRHLIFQALHLQPEEIISENPFFQHKTVIQPGCQIDYLIQTKFGGLYVCEIKFSKNVIGSEVISEVHQKIKRLKKPKGFSCRPVLIHVNGVSEDVIESEFFSHIIDFSQLL